MLFLFMFSCSNSEQNISKQSPQQVEILRTPKHVSSSKDDFIQNSFLCCNNEEYEKIVTTYVDLTQAMAQDNEKTALEKRNALQEQLTMLKSQEDPSQKQITELREMITTLQPTSLQDLQKNFAAFSIKMVEWVQLISKTAPIKNTSTTEESETKSKEHVRIIVGFCPMAPPPGRWLQREDIIQNPFYGSKMLTCGVFE